MFLRFSNHPYKRLKGILIYMWKELLFTTLVVSSIYILHESFGIQALAMRSAIPLGVVGTALAIFLGFRNNSAYDRWWEGRKIWGGIVNSSRAFGIQVMTYVTDSHMKGTKSSADVNGIHQELIYRHIAYINALRLHLRKQNEQYEEVLAPLLAEEELEALFSKSNKPTQINFNQSQRLKSTLKDNLIEDFRLYEMMHTLETLYTLQGQAERIKNTPFPIYYSLFTRMILYIFVAFIPLNLIGMFQDLGTKMGVYLTWAVVPVSIITAFMLAVIERTARTTENPFENFFSDVPMNGLCRTIEIDLREMLGETDTVPAPIEPEQPTPGVYVIR